MLGDPLRLGQILINLVGNAIKFTHTGQVMVTVERDPARTAAGAFKFTVTDTGIGIAADKLDLLFDPFSQADSSTSRKYGGSGLGLAIVARLVALMHGTVEVASEPGIGQCVFIHGAFGIAGAGPSRRARTALRRHANYRGSSDNADSRSIVAELLTAQGADGTSRRRRRRKRWRELRARQFARLSAIQVVVIDSASPRSEAAFKSRPNKLSARDWTGGGS